jgi:hypothetical protein
LTFTPKASNLPWRCLLAKSRSTTGEPEFNTRRVQSGPAPNPTHLGTECGPKLIGNRWNSCTICTFCAAQGLPLQSVARHDQKNKLRRIVETPQALELAAFGTEGYRIVNERGDAGSVQSGSLDGLGVLAEMD